MQHARAMLARLCFHVAEAGALGFVKNARSRLGTLRAFGLRQRPCDVTSRLTGERAAELDELWRRCAKGYGGGEQPQMRVHDALVYSLRCRWHLDAVMAARHDRIDSTIVDYCGPAQDRHLMAELGAHVVADLARRQTVRIRAATGHAHMIDALEYIGFVRSRSRGAAANTPRTGLFHDEGTS